MDKVTVVEEQELREEKRARNLIWAAAENYGFEPLFLAFTLDGNADLYLNMIIGLTYKWYEQEKIDDFSISLMGKIRNYMKAFYGLVLKMRCIRKNGPSGLHWMSCGKNMLERA